MADRYGRAGPSRRLQPPSSLREDLTSKEENNRRLRQAIGYLQETGGMDSDELYLERLGLIDDILVKQYAREGYTFDHGLHDRLSSLVEQAKIDFTSERAVMEDYDTIDRGINDALYREDEPPAEYSSHLRSASKGKSVYRGMPSNSVNNPNPGPLRPFTSLPPPNAVVRENEYLYGGPKNEVEVWHKDAPPVLPFGETFYMQELESLKIDYDLRESAKKKPEDKNPIVGTDVPYSAVRWNKDSLFDSGSRFKIPRESEGFREYLNTNLNGYDLDRTIMEFNQFDLDKNLLIEKDYAPRIFLPSVDVDPDNLKGYNARRSHQTSSAVIRQRSASNHAKSNRIGAIDPELKAQIKGPFQFSTYGTGTGSNDSAHATAERSKTSASNVQSARTGLHKPPTTPSWRASLKESYATPPTSRSSLERSKESRVSRISKGSQASKVPQTSRRSGSSIETPMQNSSSLGRLSNVDVVKVANHTSRKHSTVSTAPPTSTASLDQRRKRKHDPRDETHTESASSSKRSKTSSLSRPIRLMARPLPSKRSAVSKKAANPVKKVTWAQDGAACNQASEREYRRGKTRSGIKSKSR